MVSESEFEPGMKLLMGIPLPLLSLTVNVTVGFWPARAVGHADQGEVRCPGCSGAWSGMVCAPMMEASNGSSPCGMWHVAHCGVVDLRPPRMVDAGHEIDVIVARTAGRRGGRGEPGVGLRGSVLGIVAGLAALDVSRDTPRWTSRSPSFEIRRSGKACRPARWGANCPCGSW